MLDTRTLTAGDLLQPDNDPRYLHFVEQVGTKGCWMELVGKYDSQYKRTSTGKRFTRYYKVAGHGWCWGFDHKDWKGHTKVGHLPALVGVKSISIDIE